MKKRIFKTAAILSTLALSAALLAGCAASAASDGDSGSGSGNLIRVGVCAGPYEDMFKDGIPPQLEAKGYTIKYVDFSDMFSQTTLLRKTR